MTEYPPLPYHIQNAVDTERCLRPHDGSSYDVYVKAFDDAVRLLLAGQQYATHQLDIDSPSES